MRSGSGKNRALRIGITGGIGSGKTIVTRIFELLGVPVYNADDRARWIQDHDEKVREELIRVFGEETYAEGRLDRAYLARKVFNDAGKLTLLNSIVHPRVSEDFDQWAGKHQESPYLLKEAALFYEASTYKDMDRMITVYSPLELRIGRVAKRDAHRSEADIRSIIARQLSDEEKRSRADYVVFNDDEHMLIPQVLELDKVLRNLV